MSSAHIAFCNKDEDIAEVPRSIQKYGDVKYVTIFNNRERPKQLFEKISGALYVYKCKLFDYPNEYQHLVDTIIGEIKEYQNDRRTVFINITHATPLQSFAVRMATFNSPAEVYYIITKNNIEELVKIPVENMPPIRNITPAGLQILRLLAGTDNYKTQKETNVLSKYGNPVSDATKINGFKQLRELGLIEEVVDGNKSNSKTKKYSAGKPGPVAKKWRLSKLGQHFYSVNKSEIPIIEEKIKRS